MLDNLEKIAKIVSLMAIPLMLWWLGTQYQSADTKAKTAVEYVKLSISIIENQNEADPALMKWASDTLNHYSEVKFGAPLKQALASGEANVSPTSATEGWFAVVGSVRTIDEANRLVSRLGSQLPASLVNQSLKVYKTEISKLYAVTVGGETSKSDALHIAKIVRESGLVSDAFAQRNKGWNEVEI